MTLPTSGQAVEKEEAVADRQLLLIEKSAAPLRRNVLEVLRTAIIEGQLVPGSRLVERELIQMTGVSRTVIREVLRQLESEGLIDIVPNKGPFVRKLTLAEAKDLYLIRSVLEGLSARLFVEHATDDEIRDLQQALAATEVAYKERNPDVILNAKNKFYDVLASGAKSDTLSAMIATLHARIRRWRALGIAHPRRSRDRSRESIRALQTLVQAIIARDANRAEETARDEVTKAAAEVMHLLREEEKSPE